MLNSNPLPKHKFPIRDPNPTRFHGIIHGQLILYFPHLQTTQYSTRFRSPNSIALKLQPLARTLIELKRSSGSLLGACKVGHRIYAIAAPVMDQTVSKAPSIVEVDLGNRSYPIYIGSRLLINPTCSKGIAFKLH